MDKVDNPRISEIVWITLALFITIGLQEAFWLRGPLERDQSIYFLIAHKLIQGKLLYTEVWDHKPPAIHLAYYLPQLIFGYSIWAVWCLSVFVNTLSGIGLYLLIREKGGAVVCALIATALWAFLALSPNFEANQPNTESFINCCWIWCAYILSKQIVSLQKVLLAGSLIAVATLFKPIAIVLFIPIALYIVIYNRRQSFLVLSVLGISPVILWAGVYGYFYLGNRGDDFYQAVIEYNQWYAGSVVYNLKRLLQPSKLLPLACFTLALPLATVFVTALCNRRALFWVTIAYLAAYLSIALPGNNYLHYYQYLLPPTVLSLGLLLQTISEQKRKIIALGIFVVILLFEGALVVFPERFHRAPTYPASLNMAARSIAPQIRSQVPQGDWFFEWGAQPVLYFESGIEPRHDAFHINWLLFGPMAEKLSIKTLEILEKNPPVLIVVSTQFTSEQMAAHPLWRWIQEHYNPPTSYKQGDPFVMVTKKTVQ